eukprot:1361635-Amorphochlora_amoeboformis.AAC.1
MPASGHRADKLRFTFLLGDFVRYRCWQTPARAAEIINSRGTENRSVGSESDRRKRPTQAESPVLTRKHVWNQGLQEGPRPIRRDEEKAHTQIPHHGNREGEGEAIPTKRDDV